MDKKSENICAIWIYSETLLAEREIKTNWQS